MVTRTSRRQLLAVLALVLVSGFGGCLTLDPTVSMNTDDSKVFESVSTTEPWASGRVKASVTLTPNATTSAGVTKLTVISEKGTDFDTVSLEGGQTSAIVYLPTGQNATIVAVDTIDGTIVETRTVTTGGKKLSYTP